MTPSMREDWEILLVGLKLRELVPEFGVAAMRAICVVTTLLIAMAITSPGLTQVMR